MTRTQILSNREEDQLHDLRREVSALFFLVAEVLERLDRALPEAAPPAPGIDPDVPAGRLADDLIAAIGARRSAVLRTKLNNKLETRAGRRFSGVGGSARVRNGSNGTGRGLPGPLDLF